MGRKKLFSDILTKARNYNIKPSDERMDYLISLFTGGEHRAHYLGRLGNPERGEVSDYVLIEWDGESEKGKKEMAAICMKGEKFIEEPDYTFLVFDVNGGSPHLKVIHPTEKPTKRKTLAEEMGSMIPGTDLTEEYLILNTLKSALLARIREEEGS